ncbi:MAG: HAD hydrolase-like protein [Chitinispirillia bacterium]|jgi:FMN phosphatase YigB (HAD superfamily)
MTKSTLSHQKSDKTWGRSCIIVLEMACSALNVAPRECILVGDKLSKDVACARNAGAKSIWYNSKRKKIQKVFSLTMR